MSPRQRRIFIYFTWLGAITFLIVVGSTGGGR